MNMGRPEEHLLRVIVEERLRDELSIHNWWATTGKALGWTISAGRGRLAMEIEHRARLRLLVSMLRSVRHSVAPVTESEMRALAGDR